VKAAVLFRPGEELRVLDVDLQPPGPREVLVRLGASGVCASDWHTMTGAIPSPSPCVLGHEGAGVVERVGPGVTAVSPGDHVVLSWVPACGLCRYCQEGRPNLCASAAPALLAGTLVSGERRLSLGGESLYHYSFLSTFATSTVVDEASCIPIRKDVPSAVAALVGCAVTTGFCAVTNRARVSPGSTVLIYGAGGVGLAAIMAARLSGAGQVIAVDPVASKRDLAIELGASHVLDPAHTDVVAEVRSLTHGDGADFAIEAAGRAELVRQAFEATRRGGTIVAVGVPGAQATVSLPGPDLVRHEKIVTGSLYGSCRPRQDMPMILDLYADGKLPLDRLVTRVYPLAEINQAISDMTAGELARGVIDLTTSEPEQS
jgi:NDMA-dependent alcohol dehydrogenase